MGKYKNIIVFDIWSSFGSFSKAFSNTGGLLTYLIPPKTTIIGMVAAILGYDFDDYNEEEGIRKYKIEELYDVKISVKACFDLKVKRVVFNSHYGNEPELLNVRQDVLLNPYYRIYLSFPDEFEEKEKDFLTKIKTNKTVYNLYMGRNEFFLNYEFKEFLQSVDSKSINSNYRHNEKIYGIIDNSKIKNIDLNSQTTTTRIFRKIKEDITKLASHYEYVIKDYPVRRYEFVNFEYLPISFYAAENDDTYFTNLILKENEEMELFKIGEDKWISMI
ncbi:CRISPR-associated protein Cas5 [Methanobrevibacter sp.]|uniref:CRISPR-associated protein Cas5 n=1 Tax=Methanobrevibacter sp. TaxID=66852 RepID=UPI002614C74B|nr:CRISPR-associated protein Cas5 [uncultured Methanobrevibacter sp.]